MVSIHLILQGIYQRKQGTRFGSGIGTNSKLFDHEDYIGVDVDHSRVQESRRTFSEYEFKEIHIFHLMMTIYLSQTIHLTLSLFLYAFTMLTE